MNPAWIRLATTCFHSEITKRLRVATLSADQIGHRPVHSPTSVTEDARLSSPKATQHELDTALEKRKNLQCFRAVAGLCPSGIMKFPKASSIYS